MKCSRAAYNRCAAVLIIVGLILLVAALCTYFLLYEIVKSVVKKAVPLKPSSASTDMWLNPNFDVKMSFYMFNFTNVADYVSGASDTPQLQQTGPYIFREVQKKTAWWSKDERRILYRNSKTFYHESGNLSDRILTLNVPLLTTINTIHNLPFIRSHSSLERILELLVQMTERQPFVEKTVEELLFTGYEDPLFTRLHHLLPTTPERMGFFFGQNGTDDGEYLIGSGVDNLGDVGRVFQWRNQPILNFWNTQESNMINGTDGSIYTPLVERTNADGSAKHFSMFVSSLCRSLYIEYEKDLDFKVDSTISFPSYQFTVPASVFNDSYAANDGFCQNTKVPFFTEMPKYCHNETAANQTVEVCDTCLPSGLLNVSTCQNGAPIVISSPHFMHCSDEVFNSVSGLVRDDEDHKTKVVLEPTTGAGIRFERKLQINVAVAPVHSSFMNLGFLNEVKPKIVPILWLNESAVMQPNAIRNLYDQIVRQPLMLKIFIGVVMAVSSLIIVATLLIWTVRWRRECSQSSDLERLITDETLQRQHSN